MDPTWTIGSIKFKVNLSLSANNARTASPMFLQVNRKEQRATSAGLHTIFHRCPTTSNSCAMVIWIERAHLWVNRGNL